MLQLEHLAIPVSQDVKTYQAFMIAIEHSNPQCTRMDEFLSYLAKIAGEGKVGHTTIGKETSKTSHKETDGEHIHIFTYMAEKTYHTLTQSVIKKWGLRGRAVAGQPRQYGKLRKIRSFEKMMAYTIKAQNVISTLAEKDLKKYIQISYVKEDKDVEMSKLLLENFHGIDHIPTLDEIAIYIISFHQKNQLKCPTILYIKNQFNNYRFHAQFEGKHIFSPEDIWLHMSAGFR